MPQTEQLQKQLQGRRVAILCTDGVEQSELLEPRQALLDAGAHAEIVSPKMDSVQAWEHHEPGRSVDVDHTLESVSPEDFDALVLPGGVMNPDQLRNDEKAVAFVRGFVVAGKPIAAICHGPWTLIEADGVRGKKMTSWPSLKTDLRNAGAVWADEAVIRDDLLVTSRKPDDLPDFNREMIGLFAAEGLAASRSFLATSAINPGAKPNGSAAPSAQI